MLMEQTIEFEFRGPGKIMTTLQILQSDFARKSNDVSPKVREKRKTQVPKRFADYV